MMRVNRWIGTRPAKPKEIWASQPDHLDQRTLNVITGIVQIVATVFEVLLYTGTTGSWNRMRSR
jgi:hypothetical protein